MKAQNDFKTRSDRSLHATPVPAAARPRLAALVDGLVARWLQRCAANAEAAQYLFEAGRKPAGAFGLRVRLAAPGWDESP